MIFGENLHNAGNVAQKQYINKIESNIFPLCQHITVYNQQVQSQTNLTWSLYTFTKVVLHKQLVTSE